MPGFSKAALMPGITGQDGSCLPELLRRRPMPCTASSGGRAAVASGPHGLVQDIPHKETTPSCLRTPHGLALAEGFCASSSALPAGSP